MNMKRLLISALCLLFVFPAFSQTGLQEGEIYIAYLKNEIYLQYGAPSIVELTNKLGNDTYVSPQYTKKFKGAGASYTGIGAVGYNRYLNPYFCIGGYLGVSEADVKAKDTETEKIVYTNNVRSITGMVNFGWTYFRSGIWDISCGVSAGIAHKDESISKIDKNNQSVPQEEDRLAFAYNFTVAKVRVGGGIVGGFAELGFGYKGIANAGLSIRF